ncbi:MAG: enoyl-CoA hydratase/isomerase family protein [Alphaproteobacteria bacterium]|jgi:enoyl-CoA hydratase/carnithine racemase|nr:enoyl-CoA hydratase/isomerase family protein [Alphaproteobacteria bacterium]
MTDGIVRSDVLEDGVALITMDRPEKRNALTPAMIEQLMGAFDRFDGDDAVGAIVLTGAGETAFCAGHDIKAMEPGNLGHLFEEAHMQVFLAPRNARKPVIAAVNGAAYAGGFCLALNSDLRLATPDASFAVPGVRLGIVPIGGQSSRLPHLLPVAIANELTMRGVPLTSARAEHFGFVNAVVPAAELVDRAVEMAAEISRMSPFAVQSCKRIAQVTMTQGVEAADAMEYWLAMAAGHGPDVLEGLTAFRERRQPSFGSRQAT